MPSLPPASHLISCRHAARRLGLVLGLACAFSSVAEEKEGPKAKDAETQKLIDQLKARGVKIQGELRINVNGQVVVVKDGGETQVTTPSTGTSAALQGPAHSSLRWRNGEKLTGELAGVKDGRLLWWSPSFAQPLSLDMTALKGVDLPPSTGRTEEPFAVLLRDGSRLFGTPVSLTSGTLKFRSSRHGEVELRLEEIVRLQRTRGEDLLYQGPDTPEGWRPAGNAPIPAPSPAKPDWRTQEDGTFGSVSWNRGSRIKLDVPDKVDVLLRLSSSKAPPEFTFTLDPADTGPSMTIENWSNTLVLTYGTRFVPLMELEGSKSVSVRLLWDRPQKRAFAYTREGVLLGELGPPPKPQARAEDQAMTAREATVATSPKKGPVPAGEGVMLRNNGADLTLDELRVRVWSGVMPKPLKPTEPHVELTGGEILDGKISQVSASKITLASGREVPWEKLESVVTGITPVQSDTPPPATLAFDDGARLSGTLESVEKGVLVMRTAASASPVNASITGLQRLLLAVPAPKDAPPEPPFAKLDRLVLGKITLHGTVQGSGGAEPGWLPVGGREPVEIIPAAKPSFTRVYAQEAVAPATALVYLANGDVLPAEVRAMDETSVQVISPLSTVKELPAAQVQAVQLSGRKVELKGFGDSGWRQVRGSEEALQRNPTKTTFSQAASLAHPTILQGDEVKFVLTAEQGWGSLRVRVFTSGGDQPQGGVSFLLYLSSNELYAGQESERGGDFANQVQIRITPDQPVNIRLALQEKQVELFANNVSIAKAITIASPAGNAQEALLRNRGRSLPPPPKTLGPGIVLETVSIWGNGEQPVAIRDFSVRANPMRPWMPAVDPKAKEQTLTLPRFRSDDPPTHALVAFNGDVLRGRLEAATSTHLRLLSGLEALTVPRDRVAAVIRLQPPDKAKPSSPDEKAKAPTPTPSSAPAPAVPSDLSITHWLLLTDGGRFGLNVDRFSPDKITGTSLLLGRCEVPWDRIHTVRYSSPEASPAQTSYRDWKLQPAPEPFLPEDGGRSSPLLGKEVKDFKVPLLAGGEFDYARQRGKIVILDFWATWCGPCIQSLPELMETVASLKGDKTVADKLVFIAMNQAEPAAQVKRFVEQRDWTSLPVGLDLTQSVGRQFQVEGMPHTVLIGPDGKIAWQNTGHRPAAMQELAEQIRKLTAAKPAP